MALWLVVAALCFVAFLMFRTVNAAVFGDYSEWTYHGVLLRDFLRGHPDSLYVLKNYPVPNTLTTVGLGVWMLVLPWKIAAKVWLLCEVVLGLVAAVQLQKASGRLQGWKLLVLPAAVLLGTTFWFGFSNFNFGVYFAMLICAMLLRDVKSEWAYGLLLLAAFFSHMIPFGFAVLVMGLYAMQKEKWRLLWQMVPSFGLCLWYFAGRLVHGNADAYAGMVSTVTYGSPLFLAFKGNSYLKCWGFVNPASTDQDSVLLRLVGAKIFVLLFVLALIAAAVGLVLMSTTAWRAVRSKTGHWFFWVATVLFFVLGLVMPGAAAGISDPGGRMMQVAVWCAICVVATRGRWSGAVLGVCAIGLLAADCYLVGAVAMKPPMSGSVDGVMPARVREFAHVYYADRYADFGDIDAGKMDAGIFPTAMFLKKDRVDGGLQR